MQNGESFEVVLETIDPTEAAIVKSLLEGAGIPYLTRGEDQYDAFRGLFRGTVFSPQGRPVTFLVPSSMAEEARLLLTEGELSDAPHLDMRIRPTPERKVTATQHLCWKNPLGTLSKESSQKETKQCTRRLHGIHKRQNRIRRLT